MDNNNNNIDINYITNYLRRIHDINLEAHPEDDDDVGATIHNCLYCIAEHLGVEL